MTVEYLITTITQREFRQVQDLEIDKIHRDKDNKKEKDTICE